MKKYCTTWWRYQMETFSAILALCEGNHRSPMDSPHKGQWCGTLMCARTNGCTYNWDAGELRLHCAHHDVTLIISGAFIFIGYVHEPTQAQRHKLAHTHTHKWTSGGVKWAECSLIIGTACRVQVFSWILDNSVGLSAGIQSAGDWVSETLWVRILHSAEEDNLSPFDSKIACLCQSIEINNIYS